MTTAPFFQKLHKGLKQPAQAYSYLISVLKGLVCRTRYSLVGKRISIGKKFCVSGSLKIKGPGRVVIGKNVCVDGCGHPVTLFTYSEDAVISIGSNSFVNGTRFGCQEKISIGDYAILGDARILDTDFHSIAPNRHSADAIIKSTPVMIDENVWVGGAATILKGVHVGRDSVVGFAAVVTRDVPPGCVVAGNPACIVRNLIETEGVTDQGAGE